MPPVTVAKSPPDSRITGADSPVIARLVHRRCTFDDFAVAGHEIACLDEHHVASTKLVRGLRVIPASP